MAETEKPPEGTDIPLRAGVANRPRWWLLIVIGAVTVLVVAVVAVSASRDGDEGATGSPTDDLWGRRWRVVDVTVLQDLDESGVGPGHEGDAGDVGEDHGDDGLGPVRPSIAPATPDDGGTGDDSGRATDPDPPATDGQEVDRGAGADDVPLDGTLIVEFGLDRTVRYTGCNGGSGTATAEGNRLEAAELMSTMMGCMGPEGEALMAWDTWFGRLIGDGVEVRIEGDRVRLEGRAGSVELELDGPIEVSDPVDDPDAPVSDDGSSSDRDIDGTGSDGTGSDGTGMDGPGSDEDGGTVGSEPLPAPAP